MIGDTNQLVVCLPANCLLRNQGSFRTQLSEGAAERGTICMLISGLGVLRTFAYIFGEDLMIDQSDLDVGVTVT